MLLIGFKQTELHLPKLVNFLNRPAIAHASTTQNSVDDVSNITIMPSLRAGWLARI